MSFPRYPEYKDSGIEWFERVPSHWTSSAIKHAVDPLRPITYGIVQAGPHVDGGIPYIRPADMSDEDGVVDFEALQRTTQEIALSYARSEVREGDIVCTIGPSFGKVMVVPSSLSGANLTQGTARLAVSGFEKRFVYWALRSAVSQAQWEASVGGATFRALNLGPLGATLIPVPTVAEQRAIAAFLDRETAKIDALVAEQRRLMDILREKRQAVISHAVTKGLNPDAPMKDSGVEWLGEVPAHWRVMPMKRIVSTPITDGPHETPEFNESGVPFVSAEAVSSGVIDFSRVRGFISEADNARYSLKYAPQLGDIFIVKSGATTGVAAIVDGRTDFNIWSPLAAIRCGDEALPMYVLNFVRSRNFQIAISLGWSFGTQQNIGMKVLENLACALPLIAEQEMIASVLQAEERSIEALLGESQKVIDLLVERRAALITAAVTGQIDVRGMAAEAA